MKHDLRNLFYVNNNGSYRKRLSASVCYEKFVEILKDCVNYLNKDASYSFFKQKYDVYINAFKKSKLNRYILIELEFFSKTTTDINYYLSRGWEENEAKDLLKNRQRINLNTEQKQKRAKTFSLNYKNGKHKNFYRPSQKEYWINKGFTYEEAKLKIQNLYSSSSKKFHNEIKINGGEFLTVRQLKYWINKGLSTEDAQEQLQKIQDKRSLKYFIEKYGVKEGTEKFNKTIKKWLDTLNNKSDEEKQKILIKKLKRTKKYSSISIKLFDSIIEFFKNKNIIFKKIHYKENEFFLYDYDEKKIYFYDFTIKDLNLIIEFNGNTFHPNKQKLSKSEWDCWINPITKKTADEHYLYDEKKRLLAENRGFEYLIIWEDETFDNNKHKIINKIQSLWK